MMPLVFSERNSQAQNKSSESWGLSGGREILALRWETIEWIIEKDKVRFKKKKKNIGVVLNLNSRTYSPLFSKLWSLKKKIWVWRLDSSFITYIDAYAPSGGFDN